jgi:hypothetical protein
MGLKVLGKQRNIAMMFRRDRMDLCRKRCRCILCLGMASAEYNEQ